MPPEAESCNAEETTTTPPTDDEWLLSRNANRNDENMMLREPLLPTNSIVGLQGRQRRRHRQQHQGDGQQPTTSRTIVVRASSSGGAGTGTGDLFRSNNNNNNDDHNNVICRRNIRLTLVYTCFAFAGRSVWNQSVLSTFVYLLRDDDPASVGYVTAIMGISQLFISIPAGYFADHYRRDTILKLASIVGFLASVLSILACIVQNYVCLVIALASWGMYWGMSSPTIMALFADCISDGQRSYYFTQRSVIITLSNAFGPLVALVMFALLGDHWTINECSVVMGGGQLISLPAIIILCFFRDREHDGIEAGQEEQDEDGGDDDEDEEEGQLEQQHQNGQCQQYTNGGSAVSSPSPTHPPAEQNNPSPLDLLEMEEDDEAEGHLPLPISEKNNDDRHTGRTSEEADDDNDNIILQSSTHKRCCFGWLSIPKHRLAPLCVASADLTAGLGSGMSIRYFPIFFYHNLLLSPVQVQVLYAIFPCIIASIMKLSQQVLVKKYKYGRAIVSVGLRWLGIAFMILMVIAARQHQQISVLEEQQKQGNVENNDGSSRLHIPVWFICTLYVLRTGFINSTSALTRSILMDNVPRSERAKWSSLESVTVFGWSGSAALGGVLVKKMNGDVLPLFIVTAFIQFLSTLWLIPLIGSYDHERDDRNSSNENIGDNGEGGSRATAQQEHEETQQRRRQDQQLRQ